MAENPETGYNWGTMTHPFSAPNLTRRKALIYSMLAFVLLGGNPLMAVPNYLTRVPHADGGSCLPCHSSGGGSPRTQFGLDFAANGYDWAGIWNLDSDGDGQTNGEELGDPCGVWQAGESTPRTDFISAAENGEDTSDFPSGGTTLWFFDQDQDGVGRNGSSIAQCNAPEGYASSQGDCDDENASIWAETSVYLDADDDGYGGGPEVMMCIGDAGPQGYVSNNSDCNDAIAEVYQLLPGFFDGDLDGEGAGDLQWVCSGEVLPAGFVVSGEDCDDSDSGVSVLRLTATDADGDGCPADEPQWRCETVTLSSHLIEMPDCSTNADCSAHLGCNEESGHCQPLYFDCDDDVTDVFESRQLFPDLDGDGVGSGQATAVCAGESPPDGWSDSDTDCDDTPAEGAEIYQLQWRYEDHDGDGYTQGGLVEVCMGLTELSGYSSESLGEDCDDTDAYRFKEAFGYPDLDQDGLTGPGATVCGAGGLPDHWSPIKNGYDCDDTNGTVPALLCEDLPDACGYIDDGCPPPGTYCGPCPEAADAGSDTPTRDAGSSGETAHAPQADAGALTQGADEQDDEPENPSSKTPAEEPPPTGCFGDQLPGDFARHHWTFALLLLGLALRRDRGRRR